MFATGGCENALQGARITFAVGGVRVLLRVLSRVPSRVLSRCTGLCLRLGLVSCR